MVEFHLEEKDGGTLLMMTETGFAKLSDTRRDDAYEANDEGWATQMDNIKRHVE